MREFLCADVCVVPTCLGQCSNENCHRELTRVESSEQPHCTIVQLSPLMTSLNFHENYVLITGLHEKKKKKAKSGDPRAVCVCLGGVGGMTESPLPDYASHLWP